jgi:hypothetical protein
MFTRGPSHALVASLILRANTSAFFSGARREFFFIFGADDFLEQSIYFVSRMHMEHDSSLLSIAEAAVGLTTCCYSK